MVEREGWNYENYKANLVNNCTKGYLSNFDSDQIEMIFVFKAALIKNVVFEVFPSWQISESSQYIIFLYECFIIKWQNKNIASS